MTLDNGKYPLETDNLNPKPTIKETLSNRKICKILAIGQSGIDLKLSKNNVKGKPY